MAVTQNTYTGNGSTTNYSFTFPYQETTDIKVSLNGTLTTAYTLANATTVQFATAPANGAAIRIYRQTDDSSLAAQFYPGSAIRSQDLNDNFTQNLYVTQESNNNAAVALSTANSATATANSATATANAATATANSAASSAAAAVATANAASSASATAVATANAASSSASSAVSTANTASTNAANAVTTANTAAANAATALSTANSADADATTALSTANAASATATTAASNASTALSTANTALSNANSAVVTANSADSKADQAIAAVSNSINYVLVANVAAIPATPENDTYIEVQDSTGIQSFSPLIGRPAGFIGDPGLSVRIRYTSVGATWNWLSYYANNAEARYANVTGDTFTGQIIGAKVSNVIPFYYASVSNFPSATTYGGAVAHANDTGSLYFASNGSWVRVLERPASGEQVGFGLRTNGSGSFYWAPIGPSGGSLDDIFYENSATVTTSYSITNGKNASSVGTITLSEGTVVTIPNNSSWVII